MVNPQSRQTEQYALQARCRFCYIREIKCAVPTLEKTCTITARFYSTWNVFCPKWNGNLVMAAMSVPNSAPRMEVVWHAIVWAWERYLSETDSESCKTQTLAHTHTQTHPFNVLFYRTTRVSWYQKGKTNVDFTEARGSEWQWHHLDHMQVCTSLQTDNHTNTPPLCFLQAESLPAAQPTASKHWRQSKCHKH